MLFSLLRCYNLARLQALVNSHFEVDRNFITKTLALEY